MTPCYTIHDLARETGYSIWVIQKYISRKLVSRPLPMRDGVQGLRYSDLHLSELRQIRDIQENNMTLRDIYDRMHPLDDDEEDWG